MLTGSMEMKLKQPNKDIVQKGMGIMLEMFTRVEMNGGLILLMEIIHMQLLTMIIVQFQIR